MDTDYDDKSASFRPATPMPSSPMATMPPLTRTGLEENKPSEGARQELLKRAMLAAEKEPEGGIRPLRALSVPVAAQPPQTQAPSEAPPEAQRIAQMAFVAGQRQGLQSGLAMGLAAAGACALVYFGYSWLFPPKMAKYVPKNPID
jgi:hypothetical protein